MTQFFKDRGCELINQHEGKYNYRCLICGKRNSINEIRNNMYMICDCMFKHSLQILHINYEKDELVVSCRNCRSKTKITPISGSNNSKCLVPQCDEHWQISRTQNSQYLTMVRNTQRVLAKTGFSFSEQFEVPARPPTDITLEIFHNRCGLCRGPIDEIYSKYRIGIVVMPICPKCLEDLDENGNRLPKKR